MNSFLSELKRRNVFKVTAAYAAVAWILISIGDIFFPMLGAPSWAMKVFVLVAIVGLPIAFIFAWAFELTPEGLKRTVEVAVEESITPQTGKRLNFIVIGLLVVALSVSVFLNLSQNTGSATNDVAAAQSSVAVLPFSSRSTDPSNRLFADGIHDDLLTTLANIGSLKVISRTSVMEYRDTTKNMRQIGDELGVSTLLEGAVQRSGSNVRINVQLIDARTDEHLWASTYDRELTTKNIFHIQSEISNAIADELKAKLTPQEKSRLAQEPTQNLEAYTLYMAGKNSLYQRRLESVTRAREFFEKAIALDPSYALAHAGLGTAVLLLWNNHAAVPYEEAMKVGKQSIELALSLSKEDAEIYAALGLLKRQESNDNHIEPGFAEAVAALKRAIELNPNHVQAHMWYAGMLSSDGQFATAEQLYARAIELDPLARVPRSNMSVLLAQQGKNHEAIEWTLKTMELHPEYPAPYRFLTNHLNGLGRMDEAMAWAQKAQSMDTDPLVFTDTISTLLDFGQTEKLVQLLNGFPEEHPMYHFGQSFALYFQGDVKGALSRAEAMLSLMDQPPPFVQQNAALFALQEGDCKKSRRHFGEIYPELSREEPEITNQNFANAVAIAYCLQRDGQKERAQLLLNLSLAFLGDKPRLGAIGFGLLDAEIYALLGQTDKALSVLQQTVDQGWRSAHSSSLWGAKEDPFLDAIKDDPEFDRLLEIVANDVSRMRDNVTLAEQSGDWEPLLALVKNPLSSPN